MYELGIEYFDTDTSRQITFACYDAGTHSIWISYRNDSCIINLKEESDVLLCELSICADWMTCDDRGNLFVSNKEENRIFCIRNGKIIDSFYCEKPISVHTIKGIERLLISCDTPRNICLFDYYGKIVWEYNNSAHYIEKPGNCILCGNKILVADRFNHTITELDLYSNAVSFFWGMPGKPDCSNQKLCGPHSVELCDEGILICDTLNGRVLLVKNGKIVWQYGDNFYLGGVKGLLWKPVYAQAIGNNRYLICDADNNQVLIVNYNKEILKTIGDCKIKRSEFKMPRSVEIKDHKLYLSDTHHHRIVIYDINKSECIESFTNYKEGNFSFPRCVCPTTKNIIVVDSGNNRILLFDIDLKLKKEFEFLRYRGGKMFLDDPHDIIEDNGDFIVVDSGNNRIIKFDSSGNVIWFYNKLSDPHKVINREFGYSIADKDSNCITVLSKEGKYLMNTKSVGKYVLQAPRFIGNFNEHTWIIDDIDVDRRRILWIRFGEIFQISNVESKLPNLIHSRWLTVEKEWLYISDTGNNRILKLALDETLNV